MRRQIMHIEKATTMIIGNWEREQRQKTSVRMLASGCTISLLSLKKNKPSAI